MRLTYSNLHQPLITLLFAVTFGVPALAQEDRNSELEPGSKSTPVSREVLREGESFRYTDADRSNNASTSNTATSAKENIVKDSLTVINKPAVTKPVKPAEDRIKKEEDPSVLSFNFLYYIIQRFKLSDIID